MGYLATETISIGDSTRYTANNTYFVVVTQDSGFLDYELDGLLGLAFNPLSDGNPTFVESLKSEGTIKNAIIAMFINNIGFTNDGYGAPPSNLQIGSYNLSTYSTSSSFIVVAPVVDSSGFWTVSLGSMYLGEYQLNSVPDSVIIDSGTSYMTMPSAYYDLMQTYLITNSGHSCSYSSLESTIVCACASPSNLMGLSVEINGVFLNISASSIWYYDSGNCSLLAINSSSWLLGDVFLRNFYTVYDMDAFTVSFATSIASKWSHSKYLYIFGLIFLISI